MNDWLIAAYPWIKALHIISIIAWMAGLLYLPRLYVYHSQVAAGSESAAMLIVMERRLLRAIINPAMIAAFLFGLLLLKIPGVVDWASGWIYVKLACVAGLGYIHGKLAAWRRAFAEGRNRHPTRFFRIINEVPTLLMIIIVIMVAAKPF
jgi:protoporphyrinogen IX oxidase